MSKTKTENELIKLLQQKQTPSYLKALEQYCQQHEIIDISRGKGQLHDIVNDEQVSDLIAILAKNKPDYIVTTLNLENQILQVPVLKQLTEMLNGNKTITSFNLTGKPLTINRETQEWEFDETTSNITLIGANEEAPEA